MSILLANTKVTSIELRIPWRGCWEARATLQGAAPSGQVVIDWRGWKLLGGEVDPLRSGMFAGVGTVVVVGGYRWGTLLQPRYYSSDLGIRAITVTRHLADAAGLPLEVPSSSDRDLGRFWMRRHESAGSALTRVLGSWRVDLDGVTRAGNRPSAQLGAGVDVIDYDPRASEIKLFAERPDRVPLGAVVTSPRLPGPRRVVELEVWAGGDSERIEAHTEAA